MPIFRSLFPNAKPSFLSDDFDSGSERVTGKGVFVDALSFLRKDVSNGEALKGLEIYRPTFISEMKSKDYVVGLVSGLNGEPFYTGEERKLIESEFFKNNDIRKRLAASPLESKGEEESSSYFEDKKNWTKFWNESLREGSSEEDKTRWEEHDKLWRDFAMNFKM